MKDLKSLCRLSESANQTAFPPETLGYPAVETVVAACFVLEVESEVAAASESSGCPDFLVAAAVA